MSKYACQYVIARFVSNPIRDEARNFGIVFQCPSIGYSNVRFDSNVSSYARSAVDRMVIAAYITECRQLSNRRVNLSEVLPGVVDPKSIDLIGMVARASASGAIQFTEPCGCVSADPDETLIELFDLLVARRDESEISTPTIEAHAANNPSSEFVRQCSEYLTAHQAPVRRRFKVPVEGAVLPFDFGYKTPKADQYLLCEAVDFTKATIANRIRSLGPTVVKFDIAKTVLGNRAFRCAVIKPQAGNGNGHRGTEHDSLELSRLRDSCDEVFNFLDRQNMDRLMSRMSQDFKDIKF